MITLPMFIDLIKINLINIWTDIKEHKAKVMKTKSVEYSLTTMEWQLQSQALDINSIPFIYIIYFIVIKH